MTAVLKDYLVHFCIFDGDNQIVFYDPQSFGQPIKVRALVTGLHVDPKNQKGKVPLKNGAYGESYYIDWITYVTLTGTLLPSKREEISQYMNQHCCTTHVCSTVLIPHDRYPEFHRYLRRLLRRVAAGHGVKLSDDGTDSHYKPEGPKNYFNMKCCVQLLALPFMAATFFMLMFCGRAVFVHKPQLTLADFESCSISIAGVVVGLVDTSTGRIFSGTHRLGTITVPLTSAERSPPAVMSMGNASTIAMPEPTATIDTPLPIATGWHPVSQTSDDAGPGHHDAVYLGEGVTPYTYDQPVAVPPVDLIPPSPEIIC